MDEQTERDRPTRLGRDPSSEAGLLSRIGDNPVAPVICPIHDGLDSRQEMPCISMTTSIEQYSSARAWEKKRVSHAKYWI